MKRQIRCKYGIRKLAMKEELELFVDTIRMIHVVMSAVAGTNSSRG